MPTTTLVEVDAAQILRNKVVSGAFANVLAYAAPGATIDDGTTDATAAFQAAANDKLAVYIPEAAVSYKITQPILLRPYARVFGEGYNSVVKWTGSDLPVFAHTNYADTNAAGSEFVTLDNFRIDDTIVTARVNHWTINLCNAKNIVLSRMRIEGRTSATNTDLYGFFAGFAPGTTYSGDAWLIHVHDCRTAQFKMWLNSGDNFITRNSWYGYHRDYAIRLGNEAKVIGNEIGGGDTYGHIYLDNSNHATTVSAVKVVGNHFDGNATINTSYGIYSAAAQPVRGLVVTGNTAFNQNKEFIHLENSQAAVIAHNEMRNADADDTGEDDIYVSGWGNIIGPNTHVRSNTAPKAGTRANLALPVHVIQATDVMPNVVTPGLVSDDSDDYLSKSFIAYDSKIGGSQFRLFDDFFGPTLRPEWGTAIGSDPQCVAAFPITPARGGVLRLSTGDDAGASMAINGSQLTNGLYWTGSSTDSYGQLVFETSLKTNSITNICIFAGLTDKTTLEMPFTLAAGDTLTSNASNGAGFLFDTAADTDNIWLVGVKADADATKQNTAVAFTTNTYKVLRIEFRVGGAARFFLDGVPVGSLMSNAITASTSLTPIVAVFSRTNAQKLVDIDYILVEGRR